MESLSLSLSLFLSLLLDGVAVAAEPLAVVGFDGLDVVWRQGVAKGELVRGVGDVLWCQQSCCVVIGGKLQDGAANRRGRE